MKTWLLAAIIAIIEGLSNTHTLCRLLLLQAVLALTLGWTDTASAVDTYCSCVIDTCNSGACDYRGCAEAFPDQVNLLGCDHPIWLLAPLDDATNSIQPTTGQPFESFKKFFDISWPLIIGTSAGVALLWALVAGIEIMLSGSDSGMRDSGKNHLYSAIAGLLLIGLAGMILEILNPIFFNQ